MRLTDSNTYACIGIRIAGAFVSEIMRPELDQEDNFRMFSHMLAERGYRDDDVARVLRGAYLTLYRRSLST